MQFAAKGISVGALLREAVSGDKHVSKNTLTFLSRKTKPLTTCNLNPAPSRTGLPLHAVFYESSRQLRCVACHRSTRCLPSPCLQPDGKPPRVDEGLDMRGQYSFRGPEASSRCTSTFQLLWKQTNASWSSLICTSFHPTLLQCWVGIYAIKTPTPPEPASTRLNVVRGDWSPSCPVLLSYIRVNFLWLSTNLSVPIARFAKRNLHNSDSPSSC
jgi:hypothetical protein